jgi:chitodextrinase
MMRGNLRQRRLPILFASLIVALGVSVVAAGPATAFSAVPHGVPPRPAPPASPDPSLTAHALSAAAPSVPPPPNPLKGFAQYYFAGSNENANVYPHSIQWSYFGLSEVMTDASNCNNYNWSVLDNALNEIASYGNQTAIRFYIEYPGGTGTHPGNAIPHCFDGHVSYRNNTYWGTVSPDYDSPFLLSALDHFIAAFGARYDGDPRIGFIQMGLIGLWGEWHTWPFDGTAADGGYPNFMPTNADAARIINDYANAFHRTKIEVRYPTSAGGAANGLNVGYHDDSFCYKEGSPLHGVTLPESLGGANYAQLQLDLNEGTENKWITDSMGGEVRPEIQSSAFSYWPGGSGQVDNMQACIELEHTTWKLDQTSQSYSTTDPNVAAAVSEMGYNFTVNNSYFTNTAGGSALVGVQVSNTGVAPFYYPWTVTLGLEDSGGNIIKTWDTPWDLRTIMPLKIRAFPDWNVGSDPTYLNFGYPQYFQTAVNLSGVSAGSYQWVMRVDNPLALASSAAKPLLFSNTTQNANGWLGLGGVTVNAPSGGTTLPSTPTGLTSSGQTASTIDLSWAPSTGSNPVTGYEVFRDGTLIATTDSTRFTDPFLPASSGHSYTVEAFDSAGNLSAASAPLTVSTTNGTDTTAPSVPSGLTSTSHDGDSVGLSWTASSDDVGVAGYQILRNGTQVATATATSYTDIELSPSTSYTYTVKAYDASGNVSAASSSVSVTTASSTGDTAPPTTPTGLSSPSQAGTALDLSWTASTDDTSVAGYQIFRNGTLVGTTSAAQIGTTNIPTPTLFTDTGLTASTSYTYTVKAFDPAGNLSAASAPITVTTAALSSGGGGGGGTPPSVPTGLSSTGQTSTSISLSWTASTAGSSPVAGYDIYRNGTKVATSTSTSYTDTGLSPSTSYTYTVDAFDSSGDVSARSSSLTVSTKAAPTVPAGLTASKETSSSIAFSWTASTEASSSVAGYDIYRNGTKIGTSTSTSFTDTGLSPSTSYSYTVDAYDPAGNVSAASAAMAVSTTATGVSGYQAESPANTLAGGAIVQACSACSGGQKVGYIGNGGALTFNQVTASSAGSHTLTVYYVDGDAGRSATVTVNGTATTVAFHGTNDNNWNAVQSLTLTVTLNSGSNTIEFSNPSGYAPDIDQITVSGTGGGGGTTPPTVPTGLSSPSQTSTSISLSWTASTDSTSPVAGYDIYRNGTKIGTSTSTSFTDTGLSPSTSYTYTVDAYDSAGDISAVSAPLTVSTAASSGVTVYEADSSVSTLAGGAVVQSCSACLDGHKVGYIGNGGTLTFNQVTASSAGSRTLTIYYVDGDAGRSVTLTVNGTATTVAFHGTNDGNWNVVQSLTVTVNLNSGSNTIEFSNPSGYAPDIDHITV